MILDYINTFLQKRKVKKFLKAYYLERMEGNITDIYIPYARGPVNRTNIGDVYNIKIGPYSMSVKLTAYDSTSGSVSTGFHYTLYKAAHTPFTIEECTDYKMFEYHYGGIILYLKEHYDTISKGEADITEI